MSYCRGGWIGDYHCSNALRHRSATEVEAPVSFREERKEAAEGVTKGAV
ncbi:MAG: hypothetical protein OXL34_16890 [Gemmatimonadota bacterium]|nr:hypothetical protein [Gemmatimonadota bacterium]